MASIPVADDFPETLECIYNVDLQDLVAELPGAMLSLMRFRYFAMY